MEAGGEEEWREVERFEGATLLALKMRAGIMSQENARTWFLSQNLRKETLLLTPWFEYFWLAGQ